MVTVLRCCNYGEHGLLSVYVWVISYYIIAYIGDNCEVLCGICVWMKWKHVFSWLIISDNDKLWWCLYISKLDVEVRFSLIFYIRFMDYVDVSIEVNRVTCSRLSCPYVQLECYCTCDNMLMCLSCFCRPMSLYLILERRWIWTLDLVGLSTFVMYVYVWVKYDLEYF